MSGGFRIVSDTFVEIKLTLATCYNDTPIKQAATQDSTV